MKTKLTSLDLELFGVLTTPLLLLFDKDSSKRFSLLGLLDDTRVGVDDLNDEDLSF